jgi:hypothetical protein
MPAEQQIASELVDMVQERDLGHHDRAVGIA